MRENLDNGLHLHNLLILLHVNVNVYACVYVCRAVMKYTRESREHKEQN